MQYNPERNVTVVVKNWLWRMEICFACVANYFVDINKTYFKIIFIKMKILKVRRK